MMQKSPNTPSRQGGTFISSYEKGSINNENGYTAPPSFQHNDDQSSQMRATKITIQSAAGIESTVTIKGPLEQNTAQQFSGGLNEAARRAAIESGRTGS